MSHYNFVNNGRHIGYRMEFDQAHHKICLNPPLFHAFGVVIGVMAALASIICAKLESRRLSKLVFSGSWCDTVPPKWLI